MQLDLLCDVKLMVSFRENENDLSIYDSEGFFKLKNICPNLNCIEEYTNNDVIQINLV